MKPTDNPCYNCTERELHCHGRCEKRAAWEKKRAEEAAKIYAARKIERNMNEYVFADISKRKKRRRK